jgi:hypothetical protein
MCRLLASVADAATGCWLKSGNLYKRTHHSQLLMLMLMLMLLHDVQAAGVCC